jgi:uncharacterized protein (TIGR02001 family)
MHKLPASLLTAGLLATSVAAQAQAPAAAPAAPEPASPHTFAAKISVYSEYEFRGISQTSEKPALQLNLDYSHSSGIYAGAFLTNIEWLKDTAESLGGHTRGGTELDLFIGWKKEIVQDVTLDVGYLRYEYPRSTDFFTAPKVNTDELWIGASWKFLSAKYSYTVSDAFGFVDSKGSQFLELNIAYPLTDKITLTGQIAKAEFENNSFFDYTVYKIGGVYDFGGGFVAGAYYKDTDAEEAAYTVQGKNWSRGRGVAFVSYTF